MSNPVKPVSETPAVNANEEITKHAVRVLEEFLDLDTIACNELVGFRVKVNKELADHPHIQVAVSGATQMRVGLLGVINGILEAAGAPRIATCSDNDKLVGFTVFKPKKS